ncbi:MAG: hypothetical protein ACO24T_06120 [Hylemonella sp.]|jgi:uncharacterized protein involved in outer membrane biogenesis
MKKRLLILLLVLLAALAAAMWWLRGNLDGLIKDAIVRYGSEMTQAEVQVGSVELHIKQGQAVIRNLKIGNPAGFKTPYALAVGEIELDLDMDTLMQKVVTVRKIAIKAPDVIYEKGESMTNFDALLKNIAVSLGSQSAGKAQSAKGQAEGKKLIVDELSLTQAKAQASAPFMNGQTVSLTLPDTTLRNLGKSKGGLHAAELGQEVASALNQKLASAFSFDHMAKSVSGAFEKAADSIKGLFGK